MVEPADSGDLQLRRHHVQLLPWLRQRHSSHICMVEWVQKWWRVKLVKEGYGEGGSPCSAPAPKMVMHSRKNNKNTYKALIAAEYVGVEVKWVDDFEMGVTNLTPEFLKMNPIGKVPVLETPDGIVFESNAIARYIARLKTDTCLFGSSLIEYGQIEQWIDFSSSEIDSHLFTWARPRLGFGNHLASVEDAAIASLKRALGALNTYLVERTFLVGDVVTLADIIMTCNLYVGFKYMMTKAFTSEFPHVERYFWTMINQPNFSKILGEWKQAEAVPPVVPPKTNPYSKGKDEQEKVEFEEALLKPEGEEPPKQIEKKEAPPKLIEEAPKPKNPLDLLPPTNMILDDWKRLYSNTKTNFHEVAIKGTFKYCFAIVVCCLALLFWEHMQALVFIDLFIGFWEMFDPEGYSLWFCNYKYNDENTISFVTMNKVGGFLQRMDLARKYAFGKMLIIGNEPPFKVKGFWIFRGPEIPKFVMDECYDMELYEWTKVDHSDEAQKERVNQMIEDHEPFEGEALLDAKCFK
ncbi:hypothetical protein L1987_54952 [Smallanthus sonchifolius]|uniref:Uncharacterized protein n=1 Tax=Smallanthus sonchifolius TaxID=185202 RepID=A0ACB9E9L7_9ASTR|nr:hypothetical protein L1987_54952 [Smallanthus sonchifolius]